jgi:hypothetical protein
MRIEADPFAVKPPSPVKVPVLAVPEEDQTPKAAFVPSVAAARTR